MQTYFDDLLHYTAWANGRVLAAVNAFPEESTVALMSHVVAAQDIWLSRVAPGYEPKWALWEARPLAEVLPQSEASIGAWLNFVNTRTPEDLSRPVTYADLRGNPWTQPLQEILAHVVNHGTHHRAQVATLLRQAGQTPPVLDYLIYVRERGQREGA